MRKRSTGIITAVMLCGAASAAFGQWSPDSTVNLQICDLSGDQVIPKIASTSDGGCFISWFDQRSGSYSVYIQRLDHDGIPLFGTDGILVSDLPQQTWLVDYSMTVDQEDNAIVAFSDVRNDPSDLDVSVYKISNTGVFLWGDNGICLSDTSITSFEPNPVIAVTAENNCVFAWGNSGDADILVLQKLAPDGTKLWGDWGITVESATADLSSPSIVPSGQDSVIVMWKSSTGSYPMTVTHLYADMFDISGDGIWGDSPVLIYDSGAITPWNFPEMTEDGLGGAVCYWYDAPAVNVFNVWVQHLNSQGTMLFPMNGAQASTYSTDRLHMSPSAVFDPSSEETFVFWTETDGNQNLYGVYGQKFSQSGDRQWTDSGLELVPIGSQQISYVSALLEPFGMGMYVSFLIDPTNTALRTMKVQADGTVPWGPLTLSAGSLGSKSDPEVCLGDGDSAFFTWTDSRNDTGGIYAQNVLPNGELGPSIGLEEWENCSGLIITPNPSQGAVTIQLPGNTDFQGSLSVFDLSGRLIEAIPQARISPEGSVNWNADRSVTRGVYLIRYRSAEETSVSRLVLL